MTQDIRKLVTLKTISAIDPIEGADAIEVATVGGWKIVVAKRDQFAPGDKVVYIEIDAFLPQGNPAWDFLVEKSSRKALNPQGVEVTGHVLRTVKLRGQVSQGLILKPTQFGLTGDESQETVNETFAGLGVFKWEPPLPAGGSEIVGSFPGFITKTDSERVQNLTDEFLQGLDASEWFASEKIDGTSSTFWKIDGVLHGAGRNWELSLEGDGIHAQIARAYKLDEIIPEGWFIQGEIFGEGIQKNPLRLRGRRLAVFSASAIQEGTPTPLEFLQWVDENGAPRVNLELPRTVAEAVAQVDGLKSLITPDAQAEGVVWWNANGTHFDETGGRPNFKAINNVFLAKQKD